MTTTATSATQDVVMPPRIEKYNMVQQRGNISILVPTACRKAYRWKRYARLSCVIEPGKIKLIAADDVHKYYVIVVGSGNVINIPINVCERAKWAVGDIIHVTYDCDGITMARIEIDAVRDPSIAAAICKVRARTARYRELWQSKKVTR